MDTEPLPWMNAAACAEVSPEIWFPGQDDPQAPALRICATCPVIRLCRAYAIKTEVRHGTWGGLSQQELRRIYRQNHAEDLEATG